MTDIRSDRGPELLSREEISSLVGDLCDTDIAAIVSLQPSRAELEAALAWAELESYAVGEARRPLNGKIAEIYEILNPSRIATMAEAGKTTSVSVNDVRPTQREVRILERAYELWEQEGRPAGQQERHWYRAEAEERLNSSARIAVTVLFNRAIALRMPVSSRRPSSSRRCSCQRAYVHSGGSKSTDPWSWLAGPPARQ
jgi:hypothetical protein